MKEVEIKFKLKDFREVRRKLETLKAKKAGKVFVEDFYFDDQKDSLWKNRQMLRIRKWNKKNILTFKYAQTKKRFRRSKEIELEIGNPEKMRKIFEKFGLQVVLKYKKEMEIWQYKNTKITLDKMPLGNFLEVEGKGIEKVVRDLGLDMKNATTKTYGELWVEGRGKTWEL